MSESVTPDPGVKASSSPGVGSSSDKSGVGLGFLKSMSEKKVNRDGTTSKKRGPKPDSKPALTRRQELNRQAQRTHRERKELYIKALEDEVIRLKEAYSNVSNDRDALSDENRLLKEALAQYGVPLPQGIRDNRTPTRETGPYTNVSGFTQGFAAQSSAVAATTSPEANKPIVDNDSHNAGRLTQGSKLSDSEQAGIDFVLTLERPCMLHIPFLCDRAAAIDDFSSGHALMASCPPAAFSAISPYTPFGTANVRQGLDSGQQTWELSKSRLAKLLDLSQRLNLDGEITPVMAWGMVLAHERFSDLGEGEVLRLAEELVRKVRCYGFGAVLEEFEVRDAIQNVLSCKSEGLAY